MNILFASSEVVPFAKTGGLADVAGALPTELAKLGNQVTVMMPAYQGIEDCGIKIEDTGVVVEIPLGMKIVDGSLKKAQLPDSNVIIYFVHQPEYFHRDQLYGEDADYADNCERFVFFSRAVLEAIRLLDLKTDLIHVNDWQTSLIPALLKSEYRAAPVYENIASVITIHNLAYQGSFWHWDMLLTGLDWKYFNWREMEFFGRLNLLKTGIVFSDAINTVSPTYAAEIQTPEQGCGLEGVLQHRANALSGILNGIDPKTWNPATDELIPVNFDAQSWEAGKAGCKSALLKKLKLDPESKRPLVGIVGRLASQKGWSLILEVMKNGLECLDVNWAILGTGQQEYHDALSDLQKKYPEKLSATLAFSNELAHQIEAGADIFLMPSQYEPCGLNQMYSMAYGTVPIVRRTGGLADTVVDANQDTIRNGSANGFSFDAYTAPELAATLERALGIYRDQPDVWKKLVETGMENDWSWTASAKKYDRLYKQTIAQKTAMHQTV